MMKCLKVCLSFDYIENCLGNLFLQMIQNLQAINAKESIQLHTIGTPIKECMVVNRTVVMD